MLRTLRVRCAFYLRRLADWLDPRPAKASDKPPTIYLRSRTH